MSFLKINAVPSKTASFVLVLLIPLTFLISYATLAYTRHKENPEDKLVPTIGQMADGVKRVAFEKDRDDEYRLLVDTVASTKRFAISVAILFFGIILGLHMGLLPYLEKVFYRPMIFLDKMPALALLPILFIIFGAIGETPKIALVVVGVLPTIVLDAYLRAKEVPREQITKGFTLGATDFEVAYRIVLPQIFPKVLSTVRLNLKSVILFLIAAEAIAAERGLGYRIFLVQRYNAMDIIIPYVLWMSLLAFLVDWSIRFYVEKRYPWLDKE